MLRGVWPIVLLGAGACSTSPVYICESNEQCVTGPYQGTCQPSGLCSFPDEDCDSGQRYPEHSGPMAGECVPVGGGTAGSTGASTTANSNNDSSSGSPGSSSSGSPPVDSSSGGPPEPPGYGPCDRTCEGPCYMHGSGLFEVCTDPCETDRDCATVLVEDQDYAPVCTAEFGSGPTWCLIPCSESSDCPAGSQCVPFFAPSIDEVCLWTT